MQLYFLEDTDSARFCERTSVFSRFSLPVKFINYYFLARDYTLLHIKPVFWDFLAEQTTFGTFGQSSALV